jgi:uncharacterized repeat protein (TIGR03837 family)
VLFANTIDIFCRVVDNYGDIGVCWRLARALAALAGPGRVRLWVDNQQAFARIEPAIRADRPQQTCGGVDVVHWRDAPPDLIPHDVVIETFGCNPPPAFVERMKQQKHVWINLEYLSAEPWVESCHALPSRQPNGMLKTFFFPGFTAATGGLLREQDLPDRRDAWLADPDARWRLLRAIQLPDEQIQRLRDGARQVLLFCYPQAPARALADVLSRQPAPSVVLVPAGVYPALPAHVARQAIAGQVHIHEMAFVDQPRFDQLLWSSDLNLVRGEDSLVRALWAARPLLWHIYPQAQNIHMDKLDAWLRRSPFTARVKTAMRAWNTGNETEFAQGLGELLAPEPFAQWRAAAKKWSAGLAAQPELAHEILAYCAKQWQTR